RCGSRGKGAAATRAPNCSSSTATARPCAGRRWPRRCVVSNVPCSDHHVHGEARVMWEALGTVRDLGRLQDIATVLVRYGFGDMVRRIGLAGALERAGRLVHWRGAEDGLLQLDVPE